jgi:CHAT domain-containing protein
VDYSISYNGVPLPALPASAAEVRDIAALSSKLSPGTNTLILGGRRATSAAVRDLASGKAIVHFATHALPPRAVAQPHGSPALLPAMRASLALAGKEREGLLTADDASRLDLSSVGLVVLSGCATAAGEASGNDGLIGLRRAFHLAGASSVAGGLWPVEDAAAREWMLAFYRSYLGSRHSAPEAASRASRELLRARRARGLSTHPFSWAAFVAFGR